METFRKFEDAVNKLTATAPTEKKVKHEQDMNGFLHLFARYLEDREATITWEKLQTLPSGAIKHYTELPIPSSADISNYLEKLVVVKLNGGLGTSMGCTGPKSIIEVRKNRTFLDLTVQQMQFLNDTYNRNVPLVLMNSFNTDADTRKILQKYDHVHVDIRTFEQSCHPRVLVDNLLPSPQNFDVEGNLDAWYPPGHGDFYQSFHNSGLLREFLQQGKEICFVSNIDNLGAVVDFNILAHLVEQPQQQQQSSSEDRIEFVMEVTDKTRADVKVLQLIGCEILIASALLQGGTLINYEGKIRLLEIAQCPKEHENDFKSVKTFQYFNTNNIWANLSAIERVVKEQTLDMLEIIVNNKKLQDGTKVIQLETAIGSAMKVFGGAIGVNVPRSRFLPVKKTSDLLLIRSNLYAISNGSLTMSPLRMFPTTPLIKLSEKYFGKVVDFLTRFADTPDIVDLDHLTVCGDVTFGKAVSLRGTVIIMAHEGRRINIPDGAILDNKVVSGNLIIEDH